MQCGPVRHTISSRQTGANTDLTLELRVRETAFIYYPATNEPPIQEVFQALVDDSARTKMVSDDVLAALNQGRRCLVLSERKDHCRVLAERLSAQGETPFILDGGIRKKAREAIFENIRNGRLAKTCC
jgi:superfamily II DNA or RNA helicase